MKILTVFGVIFIMAVMVRYEWPKMNQKQKKERMVFALFSAIDLILAVVLIFFPGISGITQWVEWLYRPFSKLLQ